MAVSNRVRNWLIIIYVLAIMVFSSMMFGVRLVKSWVFFIRLDHLLHMLMFLPWMILIRWGWQKKRGAAFFFLALMAGLILASIAEGMQLFLHYRSGNLKDFLANCLGLLFGGGLSLCQKRGSTTKDTIQ